MSTDLSPGFYLALEESPGDVVTLLALADWYDEQGDPDAAGCLRWVVRLGKWPFRYHQAAGPPQRGGPWREGWWWWAIDGPSASVDWGLPAACLLPPAVWQRMVHGFPYRPAVFKEYATVRDAYEALIDAWARVRPDAPRPAGRARS